MPWGAAIGAVGSIAGGMLGSSGAKKAAQQQAAQAREAMQFQQPQLDRARADQEPFRLAGEKASNLTLSGLMDPQGEFGQAIDVQAMRDPSFDFMRDQGEKGLLRQMSARGVRMAPASMMALTRYNQDYAGTKYGEAFNRALAQRQSRFGMLSDLANRGQAAASGMAQQGQAGAQSMSNLLQGVGNAQAAGTMGAANAWGGALKDTTKYGIDAYLRYQDSNK